MLGDVRKLDTFDNSWSILKTTTGDEMCVSTRRAHAACMVGKHMVVWGGVNENSRPLNDVWALSLESFRWANLKPNLEGTLPDAISHHKMVSVFPKEFNSMLNFTLFKNPDVTNEKVMRSVKKIQKMGV